MEKAREYCVQAYARCGKKCRCIAADDWINREWLKIIAEYSPKDTMQIKQGSTFCILICLKINVLNI
jgi:hypothetical protein